MISCICCSECQMNELSHSSTTTLHVHQPGSMVWEWWRVFKIVPQNWKWVLHSDSIISIGNNGIEIIIQPQNYTHTNTCTHAQNLLGTIMRNHKHIHRKHTRTLKLHMWSNFKMCDSNDWNWHRDKSLIRNSKEALFLSFVEMKWLSANTHTHTHMYIPIYIWHTF